MEIEWKSHQRVHEVAHEIKYSTILIIKYIYIKTAASYLFLTTEVAKTKRKDNDGVQSPGSIN